MATRRPLLPINFAMLRNNSPFSPNIPAAIGEIMMPRNPFSLSVTRQIRTAKTRPSQRPNVTYDFTPINNQLDAAARSVDPELADATAEITEAVKAELADCLHEMQDELVAEVLAEQAHTPATPPQARTGPPWRRQQPDMRRHRAAPQPKPEPLDIKVVVQPDKQQ
jgi:hypothetical protein